MSSRFISPFYDVGSGIKPPSGAQLLFFKDDGVTPKDTYSDQLATPTPNTNPVIADSYGVFGDIYLIGSYKVTLKDKNGTQIYGLAAVEEVSTGDFDSNLINDLSQTYDFPGGVAEYKSFTTEFPVGKRIYLADRDAYFLVISGTGTANTHNIIASDEVNQSVTLDTGNIVNINQLGLGGVDDGVAINIALSIGPCEISKGTYNIKTKIDFKNSLTGIGEVTFQQVGFIDRLGELNDNNVKVENITFKGSLTDGVTEVTNHHIVVPPNVTGIQFVNCEFTDMKGITSNQQYAVEVDLEGTDVEFIWCKFKNIQQVGSNPPQEGVSPGFCGGIFSSSSVTPVTNPNKLRVSCCDFEEIATIKNPDYVGPILTDFDADAIRFFSTQTDYNTADDHDITIRNCNFKNVQKRCVKNTGVNGVTMSGFTVDANNTTTDRPRMVSIVGLQPAANCKISDVKAIGKFSYLFRITAADTVISDVKFDDKNDGYVFYMIGVEDRDTLVQKNVTIRDFHVVGAHTLYRGIDGSSPSFEIDDFTMRDIEFSWKLPAGWTGSVDHVFEMHDLLNANFKNINVYAKSGEISAKGFLSERCDSVTLDNVILPCSDLLIEENDSGSGGARVTKEWEVVGCDFLREGTVAATDSFVRLPASAVGFTFDDCDFRIQSTVANTNYETIRSDASGTVVKSCDFKQSDFSTNAFLPFSNVRFTASGARFLNNTFYSDGTDVSIMTEVGAGGLPDFQVVNNHSDQKLVRISGVGNVLMNNSSDDAIISGGGSFTADGNNLVY